MADAAGVGPPPPAWHRDDWVCTQATAVGAARAAGDALVFSRFGKKDEPKDQCAELRIVAIAGGRLYYTSEQTPSCVGAALAADCVLSRGDGGPGETSQS